ncbi:uncharacterized protein N7482_000029 [Penicillium canariense]|uniref:Acetyl-CoA synthetase-like protein n=1 Tax=Penicillium canariense TaxID=189055 RepID=A0A9W9LSR3_9EURO|nr:uncharacterized protein N7482_000029 [Penicillium canariense]KAJ5174152.1 hypothetical protein N7482_000029 [Penicillium canariense]
MPIDSPYPRLDLVETDIFSFLFDRKGRPFPDHKGNHSLSGPYPPHSCVRGRVIDVNTNRHFTGIFQDATDFSRRYTFGQLREHAIGFGKGLRKSFDFKKSDVLGIYAPNDVDMPPVIFGTLWAGGVVSPANPAYTATELAYQLGDSGARVLVTHISVLDTAREACAQVGIPEGNILLLGMENQSPSHFTHWKAIKDTTGANAPAKISPKVDVAFLVYSSGTTGRPKGVCLSHYNMTSNVQQIDEIEKYLSWDGSKSCPGIPDAPQGEGDKIIGCLPFFHIYGLTSMIHHPVLTGIHCFVMARFDLEDWCRLVQDHKVTFGYLVPPIVLLLAKHPVVEGYDLSSLRMSNSGAAPLKKELIDAVYARKGIRVKQGYGLSETSPGLFGGRWEDWNKAIGSVGNLVSNAQAKFVALPEGEGKSGWTDELPQGEAGELLVKGPNVFAGYHHNPEATAECLRDGWFKTGDVGYIDPEGFLYITDRIKELIKYKGFPVAPAELEGSLIVHELVADGAVVGVESEAHGTEVPMAYVVRKGGMAAVRAGDDQKIIDYMSTKVANHKRLRGGIKFVESIPRNASGKILRRELRIEANREMKAREKATGGPVAKL